LNSIPSIDTVINLLKTSGQSTITISDSLNLLENMTPRISKSNIKQIAKIIHQSWKSPELPPRQKVWSATWKACFPDFHYILWTDDDNRNFLVKFYPWFLDVYDSYPAISKADSMRYFYLYHFGGIYTDLDNECLHNFEHLLLNHRIVLGAMEGQFIEDLPEGYVQNSFMYSLSNESFWLDAIDLMVKLKDTWLIAERKTGPGILLKTIKSYRNKNGLGLKIYPPMYFCPFSWLRSNSVCKDKNKMTDDELNQCRNHYLNSSYVLQYHVHNW